MKVLSNFSNGGSTRGVLARWKARLYDGARNIETPWLIGKVMATLLGDVL